MRLRKLSIIILISTALIFFYTYSNNLRHSSAHIFISNDDASSFLTLLERVRIEALLVNKTMFSNLSSAQNHVEQLLDRIDDIKDSENDFYIQTIQFKNTTVNWLLMANLLDEVLTYYGGSFGILPHIMINMSYINPEFSKNLGNASSSSSSLSLTNMDKYQTAQEYAKRVFDIYNIQSQLTKSENSLTAKDILEDGLFALRDAIDNKADPFRVMEIVHMQIHPNLQIAYDLTLK